jgi:iron complex transport system ATP-binding protein
MVTGTDTDKTLLETKEKTLIEMRDGAFSFGQTLIFKQVNLQIAKGEIFCLLGPNGCGKTTLIDCVLGILQLDSGRIFLQGRPWTGRSPRATAQVMAYVPQRHDRHFAFSVLDLLLMGRTPYTPFYGAPGRPDMDKAKNILDMFGLSHLIHRDYTLLSGGETQLVMIMRALIQDTPVIIMDEPTSHLDFRHELMVLETLVRLVREQHLTLVMATHFPNHAFYFENAGIPVSVNFMGNRTIYPAGRPSDALTEANLARFYHIETAVMTHTLPGKGIMKQIVPIKTLDNKPETNP